MDSPPMAAHPFLQPGITLPPSPEGSLKQNGTTYYTPRPYSDHHVSLYGGPSPTEARPPSVHSASVSISASVTALSARQRPPSAPPRSVRGATGEKIVGGIQRTPISEIGVTPAMEVAAAAAPLVAPVRQARESNMLIGRTEWEDKVIVDLKGWRGGHGKPQSAIPIDDKQSYYGQPRTGVIGTDLPKEILRIPRDWTCGDVCQFVSSLPPQLENRISPAAFAFFVQAINIHLRDAYSVGGAIVDNVIAVATLWTSLCWRTSHFEKELRRAEDVINQANKQTFNPKGLNVLSPRDAALQYLEIEYY